jgi:15-cis-phytoene synthase
MSDEEIFKKGSTTYYWSSKLFSEAVRGDVFKLYSFVRVVDDYVDSVPSDVGRYNYVIGKWRAYRSGSLTLDKNSKFESDDKIVQNIIDVVEKYKIDNGLVDAFIASMQMDIDKKTYLEMSETIEYMYGSAEVIGSMMSQIIGVPDKALQYARLQGRAMQYINFIRDIDEDNVLGRQYFPISELKKYNLTRLTKKSAADRPEEFVSFMNAQLDMYEQWQSEANKGFKYIPRKSRIAVRTAADMYSWTAKEIRKDPFVVFEKKIKPSRQRVIACGIKRGIYS